MTPKQQRFVEEYLVDHNATQAAVRAGYSRRTAAQQGHRLSKRADVAAAVAKRQAEIAVKLAISQEAVRVELAKIAVANMLDYMQPGRDGDPYPDFSRLSRDQAAALIEVTVDFKDGSGKDAREVRRVKFRLADKRAALVDLGRHLGMFKEVHEHTGTTAARSSSKRFTRVGEPALDGKDHFWSASSEDAAGQSSPAPPNLLHGEIIKPMR